MTHPMFRNHDEEIAAARAAHDADRTAANTHSAQTGPLVLPNARARYLDSLPGKPEPTVYGDLEGGFRVLFWIVIGTVGATLLAIALKGGA